MNDKSKIIQSDSLVMEGAPIPSMQRVFAGNGANVPQMQALPTTPASQQSSKVAAQQPSATSSNSRDNK
ncbi:TPA: hypothetical protein ACNH1V_003116 [Citrobacter koseri]|uniref:hypothetical protein n=1 Tax=uncultured Citrobacter sp. TaxID=200446 RepID=UPI00259AAA15|nr:hypothetical protein [uncultured Citrobacter sp.]